MLVVVMSRYGRPKNSHLRSHAPSDAYGNSETNAASHTNRDAGLRVLGRSSYGQQLGFACQTRLSCSKRYGFNRLLVVLLAPVLALLASSCVKANAPVIQNGPARQGAETASPAQPQTNSQTSSQTSSETSSTAIQTTNQTTSSGGNSGVVAEPGSAVVDAIRKGPLQPNGTVTHVVDGDTVDVAFATNVSNKTARERVRLIGIDTPETKRPDTPIECFGREASSALAALIPVGTPVMVERDVEERDRYGRLLGYVFRASDGLFVNHEMVRAGMAMPSTFPPNIAYVDVFAEAGDASRAAAVGLWSRCESGHTPATG
jgi:micrococcal nuclease